MNRIEDFQAFAAIVDYGSLTAAARQLGRSLQSVSRSLAADDATSGSSSSAARRAAQARPMLVSLSTAALPRRSPKSMPRSSKLQIAALRPLGCCGFPAQARSRRSILCRRCRTSSRPIPKSMSSSICPMAMSIWSARATTSPFASANCRFEPQDAAACKLSACRLSLHSKLFRQAWQAAAAGRPRPTRMYHPHRRARRQCLAVQCRWAGEDREGRGPLPDQRRAGPGSSRGAGARHRKCATVAAPILDRSRRCRAGSDTLRAAAHTYSCGLAGDQGVASQDAIAHRIPGWAFAQRAALTRACRAVVECCCHNRDRSDPPAVLCRRARLLIP